MAQDIKRATAFASSKKIAELETSDYSENTNGEQQHGVDGVIGITVGNPEVELTFNVVRPVAPSAGLAEMETAIKTQKTITLAYKIGSDLIYANYKCMSRRYTSESRTGSLKGVFVFRNADNPQQA